MQLIVFLVVKCQNILDHQKVLLVNYHFIILKNLAINLYFLALAYQDYNVDNQPDPESSKATLLKNTRDGMICLLHAVSKTNATILDSLIKEWKNRGYEFKTLDDLPN